MIVNYDQLSAIRAEAGDSSIALRLGCYDLLHSGHLEGVQFASEQSDVLVVGVASDQRTQRLKGPDRPIESETLRLAKVDALPNVDWSFIMPASRLALGMTIWKLHPDVFVEGGEHPRNRLLQSMLATTGIRHVIDTGQKVDSTTQIVMRMNLPSAGYPGSNG